MTSLFDVAEGYAYQHWQIERVAIDPLQVLPCYLVAIVDPLGLGQGLAERQADLPLVRPLPGLQIHHPSSLHHQSAQDLLLVVRFIHDR